MTHSLSVDGNTRQNAFQILSVKIKDGFCYSESLVCNSNPDLLASIQMCAHFISPTNYNTFSHVDVEALPPLIRTYSNHPTASKFTLIASCC